jgi:hypothetical protein
MVVDECATRAGREDGEMSKGIFDPTSILQVWSLAAQMLSLAAVWVAINEM